MKYTREDIEQLIAAPPEGFVVRDGKLFSKEGKQVIPKEDTGEIVSQMLMNPSTTGGRDRLFDRIKAQYEGISRRMIAQYLKNDFTQQTHAPLNKRVTNRIIITNGPAKMAQIDLVDMQKLAGVNNNDRYWLGYVDLFSKWMDARLLKNKTAPVVLKALEDILEKMPVAWRPKTIQSDLGAEFGKQMEKKLASQWSIKLIHSQAYNPTAQGAIERLNRELKGLIFKNMSMFGSRKWNDLLASLVKNHNTSKHSSTGWVPEVMMNTPLTDAQVEEIQEHIRRRQRTEGREAGEQFKVGDFVRIALTSLAAERKGLKFRKSYKQNWSSEVFQVSNVSEPEAAGQAPQYLLRRVDTNRPWSKKFWGYQLMKIDPNAVQNETPPAERPDFDPSIFNQEAHLQRLHEERKGAEQVLRAPPSPKQRPRRNWKPSERILRSYQ